MTTQDASFGWFSPPVVHGLEIRSLDDKPVVTVAEIKLDKPLWKLLSDPKNVGLVRVEKPQVNLVVRQDRTTNLAETFPPQTGPRPRGLLDMALEVKLRDIGFEWQLAGSEHRWSVGKIQMNVALEPARVTPSHRAELVIAPGKIFDRYELSPEMCDDGSCSPGSMTSSTRCGSGRLQHDADAGYQPFLIWPMLATERIPTSTENSRWSWSKKRACPSSCRATASFQAC